MDAPPCPDLKALFGAEYKITHDPVCYRDPKQPHIQPESKRDPWLYVLPCRYGTIYPHGRDTLAAEVGDHGRILLKLGELPGVVRRGETVLFPVSLFPRVAEIVKPKRRRRCHLSPEQLARLAAVGSEKLQAYRASLGNSPEQFSASPEPLPAESGPGAAPEPGSQS
jgi:hypothetical protein